MPESRLRERLRARLRSGPIGECLGVAGAPEDCGLDSGSLLGEVLKRKREDCAGVVTAAGRLLRLLSSAVFICCFCALSVWSVTPAMTAGLAALTVRELGTAYLEAPTGDTVTRSFSTPSKLLLLVFYSGIPVAVSAATGRGLCYGSGLLQPVSRAWVWFSVAAVAGHAGALWVLYGFSTGLCWVVKLMTDPVTDIVMHYPSLWLVWSARDWRAGRLSNIRLHIDSARRRPSAVRSVWDGLGHAWLLVTLTFRLSVRIVVGYTIFVVAMGVRGVCRVVVPHAMWGGVKHVNRRVLIVTDYMPPQVHGIAVRCHNYVTHLRALGDEVVVFTTQKTASQTMSFDYPILPSIANPLTGDATRIAFAPGVLLAWNLSAYSWDVVHVVYPSLLSFFVLPVCWLRGIPTYCSHHVDMDYYGERYVGPMMAAAGNFGYTAAAKLPTYLFASVNAAPTLSFLNQHLPRTTAGRRMRVPSGVEAGMVPDEERRPDERRRLLSRIGAREGVSVVLMVQRLAPEKGTELALAAVAALGAGYHLVVAGDGPSRDSLAAAAQSLSLSATFLGAVPHSELAPVYRAADVFLTCSVSETFGLTVMEALSCGTPAAMPHHGVFDELWESRVPAEWMYDAAGGAEAVAAAIIAAASTREHLASSPVRSTWRDATAELAGQYQTLIDENRASLQLSRRLVGACMVAAAASRPSVLRTAAAGLAALAGASQTAAEACASAADTLAQ
eukprot:TRINITY_DN9016_c0_g2_i1.p1 TRINITY_DN9016_c0_g2~~TRINITY_DN9016_c0_g2_i1.p1  ORF type:complete len:749 (+),score=190.50 TRINITY_DN9016_c0_g2_i1:67-2247(+)